jgi:hypothetical protein
MDRKPRSNRVIGLTGLKLPGLKCCLRAGIHSLAVITLLLLIGPVGSANAALSDATRQLFQAIDVNDIGAVKKAVNSGADLNAKNATGMSPADVAVDKGHFIIAHYLLSERGSRKKISNAPTPPVIATSPASEPKKPVTAPRQPAPKKLVAKKPSASQPKKKLESHKTKRKKGTQTAARKKQQNPFKMPPRKPRPPETVITDEIAIAPAPGVDAPDGTEPPESTGSELPELAENSVEQQLMDGDIIDDGIEVEISEDKPSNDTLGTVGTFFQNLVDLVTPDGAEPPQQEQAHLSNDEQDNQSADNNDSETDILLSDPLDSEPETLIENDNTGVPQDSIEAVDITDDPIADVLDEPGDGPGDALEELAENDGVENDNKGEQDDDSSLFGNLFGDNDEAQEPSPEPVSPSDETSASRTFARIKGLLSTEKPEEDEFGLPIIDSDVSPPPEIAKSIEESTAVDSVLDQLEDPFETNLDDNPGPETGAPLEPILSGDTRIKTAPSPAMRNRLERMREALSRNVEVDTNAILEASRKKYADIVAAELPPPSKARSDVSVEKMQTEKKRLEKRSSTATRFSDRLDRIRKTEKAREDVHGLPIKKAEPKSTPASVNSGSSEVAAPADEDSTIDRIVGFFTKKKGKGGKHGTIPTPGSEAPAYTNAPDIGTEPIPDKEQPDIANLDAFDQADETAGTTKRIPPPKPAQDRGNMPPEFLNRLAVLFNKEKEATKQTGWQATTSSPDGRSGGSQGELPAPEETSWTTTSKLNIGVGRPMAILKVTQTDVPEPEETTQTDPDATSGKQRVMAQAPYSDPLKSPEVQKTEKKKAFFSRLTQLFQPKDRDNLPRESLLLEQDEKLSTRHDALKKDVLVASRTVSEAKTYWPVTELTKSDTPLIPERRNSALTRTSLSGVALTLGTSVNLDNIFPPGEQGTDPGNVCVKKNRGTTLFCIEPIDWPEELRTTFQVTTILYTGPMAITRFDQGAATRMHSLFNSDDYEKVTAYYQKRFGEPTEIWKRSIAPLAKPRQDNPTVSWRDRDPETNAITILEIRKFDDTRGGFPDTNRGAAMLYFVNSPGIFPQVSSHELMQLKRVAKLKESDDFVNPDGAPPPTSSAVAPDELFDDTALPSDDTEPGSDAGVADPILDQLINETPTPGLEELMQAPDEQASPDDILDLLNSDELTDSLPGDLADPPNDLLENLPGEDPVLN